MTFLEPPPWAAWRHHQAREGFEVVFLRGEGGEWLADGHTTAVEGDAAWVVGYEIRLDARWLTRSARVTARSAAGARERTLETDGAGSWRIDGTSAPQLDGCLDVDLEASCLTNTFPVHRLHLEVGRQAEAPAAYVRALDVAVERLEQRYLRLDDVDGLQRYRYAAPSFDFECELVYDRFGLLLDYPGIGTRVGPRD